MDPSSFRLPTGATPISRRGCLSGLGAILAAAAAPGCHLGRGSGDSRVASFTADVTVPIGHGMMGGAWLSRRVADPLEAHGVVWLGAGEPVVFVSVDWCEIRNDAHRRWQEVLAAAAGTSPGRVMVSTIHQHDAPVADLTAEALLRERRLEGTVCDPAFHEVAVQRVAAALRRALPAARRVTHLGMGRARVEQVASNRRYELPDGTVRWDRTSATRNVLAIEAGEGLVDPWLRTLSFWGGDTALAALSFYAVHPMSHYGQGEVSADFPGLARRARAGELPGVAQVYVSGASGNVTAGRYNTGARENRGVLAGRLQTAMAAAWASTRRVRWKRPEYREVPLRLEPRESAGFGEAELEARRRPGEKPFAQCLAALGLSWRRRVASGRPLAVPCLDWGEAALVLVPGETYVDYQIHAQSLRPDGFVCVAGYGDGATGYVPTDRHWAEGDTNLGDWCWVAPGAEARLKASLGQALGAA